jgi:hypothetical protein
MYKIITNMWNQTEIQFHVRYLIILDTNRSHQKCDEKNITRYYQITDRRNSQTHTTKQISTKEMTQEATICNTTLR